MIEGIRHALAGGTPEESHDLWVKSRIAEGWVQGPVKDFKKKVSPSLVPYAELPDAIKKKDTLFQELARSFAASLPQRE
mgnify:FL=1